MTYKTASKKDSQDIIALAKKELNFDLNKTKLVYDLKNYPNEVAVDKKGLFGVVLSKEISTDILVIYLIAIRSDHRCDKTGRSLIELIESKAAHQGYYSVMISNIVQKALIGCASDEVAFAGYKRIYQIGGSYLLIKDLR
jgi:hypothetical protein